MKTLWHLPRGRARWAGSLATASIALLLLFGCGGVGTGGTGAYVASEITGFASVFVGGVEFDDTKASVLDDDGLPVARNGNELRLGMRVEVDGSTILTTPSGKTATAATIRIATAVLGPVEAVDTITRVLTVLGQQLQINAATVFGPSLHGGLAALHAGDVVAAYALPDAVSGRYVATRIDVAHGPTAYRLRGVVSALDTAARSLRIGGATLNYASASGVPADLANGQLVRVRLTAASSVGSLNVDAFGPAVAQPADGDGAVVDGLVTSFSSASAFAVNGMAVDASHAAFESASTAVAAGVYVSVEGHVASGALIADRVRVLGQGAIDARTYQVTGAISGLDVAAETFVVRNVVVGYASAQFVNGSATDLANGVAVRVNGSLSSDGTQIQATQVAFQ
ncbi:DUF5666 domain-containing protein [Piscinibacter sp.]|uniref:DUF5666 domain-containing protein n=1 Tax=Piscinibacter sp. TaxID=1903157 RepID=UPI002F3E6B26